MTSPLVILASPLFPNVPNLPGVPPVARMLGTEAVAAAAMLFPGLASAIFGGQQPEQWGIMDKNYNLVLSPDSVVRMDMDDPYHVSDYPVEKGSFASYNKVKIPFSGTVTMSKGGTDSDRSQFLQAAQTLEASLDDYFIATPETTDGPVTIDRVSYERRANAGANFILAHIQFTEIRITPPVQYSQSGQQQTTSKVPASSATSTATSTGLPDPTATTSATAQAMVSSGSVGANVPSGAVTAALNSAVPVSSW